METMQTCPDGHSYVASDKPSPCPICGKMSEPGRGFLDLLALPARRALENAGITSAEKLSYWSEKEILGFHGVGKTSLPSLRDALHKAGLTFREDLRS
jgi:DNA-directed RNA polymerase alpha subunit